MAVGTNPRKLALAQELDRARSRAGAFKRALQGDLEAPGRVKANFKRGVMQNLATNRIAWLSGATLLGVWFTGRRPKVKQIKVDWRGRPTADKQVEKAGKGALILAVAKIALDFAKPALTTYLARRMGAAVNVETGKKGKDRVEIRT